MIRMCLFLLVGLLLGCNKATPEQIADSSIQALVWQLDSSDFGESKISIHQNEKVLANYSVDCDLSATFDDIEDPENPTVDIVNPTSHPQGLLIVVCNVGAHAKLISVFEPFAKTDEAVFSKTGSYVAGWDLINGKLNISYDRECEENETKLCEQRFEQVSMEWPN
jgi:hypothetical protein